MYIRSPRVPKYSRYITPMPKPKKASEESNNTQQSRKVYNGMHRTALLSR